MIKGQKITRIASRDEPAYLVRQDDGDEVLKSASELARR
jgi:Hypervirulence associated proteins TUDOR domain